MLSAIILVSVQFCLNLKNLNYSDKPINQIIMQTNKWSIAALDGLLLALITIIATLIQTIFEPGSAITWLLWLVKLVSTVGLLYYFVKDYSKNQELFTYKDGFRFGFMVSVLSSLICGCYMFLHYTLIFPDSLAKVMESVSTAMQSSGGDTTAFEKIQKYVPHFISVFSLIYYSIFGLIASAIIANSTKKGDVFTE